MQAISSYSLPNYTPAFKAPRVAQSQQFALPQWQNSQSTTKPLDPVKQAKQDKAAKEYEGVFISQMLQPMFDTVETDQEFGGGQSEQIYKNMMVQEYGKQMAAKGGIGLAKYISSEMAKKQ